jgi:uncharacterized protein (DUF488 family)
VDVRSSPYSKRAPHFNRMATTELLSGLRIRYFFGGKSLGGRPADRALYDETNRASYVKMARTDQFRSAIEQLRSWSASAKCVLMCAEAEPLECHRFLLIGRALSNLGVEVQHILPNGRLESHADGELRLVARLGLTQSELFERRTDTIDLAYKLQESRVAYRAEPVADEVWSQNK